MLARFLILVTVLLWASSVYAQLPTYTLHDLGSLSQGVALNNGHTVVGLARISNQNVPAKLWPLPVQALPLRTLTGLNDNDDVSGSVETPGGLRGVLHNLASMTTVELPSLNPTQATDVNNAGDATGGLLTASNVHVPLRYLGGVLSALPVFGDLGVTNRMNNGGDICGHVLVNGRAHAVCWPASGCLFSLNTIGALDSFARDVNDGFVVVGQACPAGKLPCVGFRWTQPTGMQLLSPHAGYGHTHGGANGINSAGWIVGQSLKPSPIAGQPALGVAAVIYAPGSTTAEDIEPQITNLGGFSLTTALGITDTGAILASARGPDGKSHAVLLVNDGPLP